MARQATGTIIEKRGKDGLTYRGLRFTAYGKRRFESLGTATVEDAEAKLRHTLADVERGTWKPPGADVEPPAEPEQVPTFHQFSEDWWLRTQGQLAAKTRTDYRWRLEYHLLKYFGTMPIDTITYDTVERYIAAKLAEGQEIREAAERGAPLTRKYTDSLDREMEQPRQALSPRAINMTVTLLAAILEGAVERELIVRNPAKGKKRRVRERAPARSYLETASQIDALLQAAGEQDQEATRERAHLDRRAMLATMIFAGLRIGELCSLRWRDVDLAAGWLTVGESKTDAGRRRVKIRGALRDELLAVRARRTVEQGAYVFPTRTGRRQYESKVRTGTLGGAVKRANTNLDKAGLPPLPDKLTPHSMRRTFASLLYALGEAPPVVMVEMGHTNPALALRVYAQAMRRGEDEKGQLCALVEGGQLAFGGNRASEQATEPEVRSAA
jgi:integrase